MCVILRKPSKIEIPFERLKVACSINGDGYGVAIVDRGKIEVIKGVPTERKTSPETVARILEDAKDQLVFMHLRYKTKGDLSPKNLHPFKVFDQDSQQIYLMHNGTLTGFGDKDESDSLQFSHQFVEPLLKKYYDGKTEAILSDPLLPIILEKFAQGDRIILFDHLGNNLIVNQNLWKNIPFKQSDGTEVPVLSSNDYSFQDTHARYENKSSNNNSSTTKVVHQVFSSHKGSEDKRTEPWFQKWARNSGQTCDTPANSTLKTREDDSAGERPTAVQLMGFASLMEITKLTKEDIEELIQQFPDEVVYLIMDLRDAVFARKDELLGKVVVTPSGASTVLPNVG